MIEKSLPSSVRFVPKTFGDEPNFLFQKPSVIITIGGAPTRSSRCKVTPQHGDNAELPKIIRAYEDCVGLFRLAQPGQNQRGIAALNGHRRKSAIVLLPIDKIQIRNGASGEIRLALVERDELLRIWIRERIQKHAIDNGE